MLYDLETDPDELHDLGADPAAHAGERERLRGALDRWYRRHHTRTTISDETILARAGGEIDRGIVIGFWDEAEPRRGEAPGPLRKLTGRLADLRGESDTQ